MATVFDSALAGAAYSATQRGGTLGARGFAVSAFSIRDGSTRDRLRSKKIPIIRWPPFEEPSRRVGDAISPDRISVRILGGPGSLDRSRGAPGRDRGTLHYEERGLLSLRPT